MTVVEAFLFNESGNNKFPHYDYNFWFWCNNLNVIEYPKKIIYFSYPTLCNNFLH
jgi:hypothetical protein